MNPVETISRSELEFLIYVSGERKVASLGSAGCIAEGWERLHPAVARSELDHAGSRIDGTRTR